MFNIKQGATFSDIEGENSKHSFADWSLYMDQPEYQIGSEITHLIRVPYSNHVLEFSDPYNNHDFEESTFTYHFFNKYKDETQAMLTVRSIDAFFRSFRGTVTDDVIKPGRLTYARRTDFSFDINPRTGFVTISLSLTGQYS